MANIQKRGNSYRIKVSCGYDTHGKQVIQSMTWKPDEKMTEKQMWGTDEDRMPEGTVIIFDKKFMPKEGEFTGKLKYEYHPNWIEERMEAMRRGEL